jgi:hypothetical protein
MRCRSLLLTALGAVQVSFLTVFVAASLEGWVDTMYMLQDANGYWGATIFFHVLVVLGSLFALNLALAVVADSFSQEEEEEEAEEQKTEDKYEAGEAAANAEDGVPGAEGEEEEGEPENVVRKICYRMATADWFSQTVIVMILLNTLTLCMDHKRTLTVNGVEQAAEMDEGLTDGLEISNFVFIGVFTVEAIIKIIGLGVRSYFSDNFNIFDFAIVLVSFMEIGLAGGGGAFSVLRTFRLLRVLKLTQKFQSMKVILNTVVAALPAMAYLSLLMALFMFMAAVAGMQLFGGKMIAPALEEKYVYCVTAAVY